MLTKVGLPIPGIIQLLIINPRNEIEHGYTSISSEEAKRAVELAEMFLRSLAPEMERKAIISLAKPIGVRYEASSAPGREYERIEFGVDRRHCPFLFIDVSNIDHRALMLYPKEEELRICALNVPFRRARLTSVGLRHFR